MTSVFGTDSAYYGLANNHLYLYLTDDKVKQTNTYYSSAITKGASDEDITAYTDKYNTKWNPSIFSAIKQYDNNCKNNFDKLYVEPSKASRKTTIYSVLSEIPTLSECLKFINSSSYFDILNNTANTKKTFFAFENDGSNIANLFLQKYNFQVYAIREFLKANTLDYPVSPNQIVKRKVKLTTLSKSNSIYADGRGNQMVIYIPNNNFNYYSFSKQEITIIVKGYIETDNGWLYILEAPIVPQIFI